MIHATGAAGLGFSIGSLSGIPKITGTDAAAGQPSRSAPNTAALHAGTGRHPPQTAGKHQAEGDVCQPGKTPGIVSNVMTECAITGARTRIRRTRIRPTRIRPKTRDQLDQIQQYRPEGHRRAIRLLESPAKRERE